jgi:hypothetical protein
MYTDMPSLDILKAIEQMGFFLHNRKINELSMIGYADMNHKWGKEFKGKIHPDDKGGQILKDKRTSPLSTLFLQHWPKDSKFDKTYSDKLLKVLSDLEQELVFVRNKSLSGVDGEIVNLVIECFYFTRNLEMFIVPETNPVLRKGPLQMMYTNISLFLWESRLIEIECFDMYLKMLPGFREEFPNRVAPFHAIIYGLAYRMYRCYQAFVLLSWPYAVSFPDTMLPDAQVRMAMFTLEKIVANGLSLKTMSAVYPNGMLQGWVYKLQQKCYDIATSYTDSPESKLASFIRVIAQKVAGPKQYDLRGTATAANLVKNTYDELCVAIKLGDEIKKSLTLDYCTKLFTRPVDRRIDLQNIYSSYLQENEEKEQIWSRLSMIFDIFNRPLAEKKNKTDEDGLRVE